MKDQVTLKENKWVWPIADEGSWEGQNRNLDLVNQVMPYVKGSSVMVQAGGNCGYILSTFADKFETVYTFEPDPVNFYCLTNNVTNKNVIKMQCCLGYDKVPVSIQHLVRPDRPMDIGGVHVSGVGNIPTLSIDSLNLQACNLIQFDIEGYELKALMGSVETIKKYRPVMCIEFCEKWLNRYEDNSDKLTKFLEELNYEYVKSYGSDKIFLPK